MIFFSRDFFEICDGIFLNYNWTGPGLLESRSIAERTDRVTDIYVGLDVWGRGCPGGGGFNSIEVILFYFLLEVKNFLIFNFISGD